MQRVTKLSEAQVAAMPAVAAEWLGHGLSTERADRPRAEKAIFEMYRAASLPAPKIVWCGSPLSMCLTKFVLEKDSVRASVRDSVRDSVWASVRASVRDSVWDSVGDSVGDSVWDSAYGQHDAHWLAFFRYFHDHCGLTGETHALSGLWGLSKSCGWILPRENICFASERHSTCRVNDAGLIHCENSPAIAYPDGFEIYAFNGVVLPARWVTDRETIDPAEILAEQNVEKRAAGAACVGWPRMLERLDYRVIDKDPDPDHGDLVEVILPGLPQPGRFLRATCPRNGTIMEGIPPEIDTVIAAQAWRVGLPVESFTYPEKRT